MVENKIHYFYVLKCSDGSFYGGYTTHLLKRIEAHNQGKGAKYTRSRRPIKLIYFEIYKQKSSALQAEYRFKKLRRREKIEYMKIGGYQP
jgi:putative endonuclease